MDRLRYTAFGCCFALLACTLIGCNAGANFTQAQVPPGYKAPRQVHVTVVSQIQGEGLPEATQKLAAKLREELAEHGIAATIVAGEAPAPSIRVTVAHWNHGSQGLRWLAGAFGAGEADMNVVVVVTQAPGAPPLAQGTMHGWLKGGWWGGDATDMGDEIGEALGEAIATGKFEVEDD